MRLSDVLSCFENTPITKYGAKVHLAGKTVFVESAICNAVFTNLEEDLPTGISIPFTNLKTAMKHLDDCVFTVKDNQQILLRGKGYKLQLPTIQENPPQIPDGDIPLVALDVTSELAEKIERCLPYTSKDNSKPELCAVHLRDGWVEATNRYSFIRIPAGHKTPKASLYNTVIAPIVLGLAKSGTVQMWSGDSVYIKRPGVYCVVPHMAEVGDMPTIANLTQGLSDSCVLDLPLTPVLTEVRTIATICEELSNDDSDITISIIPGRVIVATTNKNLDLNKTIIHKHSQPNLVLHFKKTLASCLPDFLPEGTVATIFHMNEDMYLLAFKSATVEFYASIIVEYK